MTRAVRRPKLAAVEAQATRLFRAGDPAAALDACRRGLAVDDGAAALLHLGAVSLVRLGRLAESLDLYERLVRRHPTHATGFDERGSILAMLGRHADAAASFDRALALAPRPETWLNKGTACAAAGRPAEALAAYDAALALRPDFALAWLGRGTALAELARMAEAADAFARACALDPGSIEARLGRAGALLARGDAAAALAAYAATLAQAPSVADAWVGRGNALLTLGQLDTALAAIDQGLALDPTHARGWASRGHLLYGLKRYDEAVAAYDRALALDPDVSELPGIRLDAKLHLCDWTELDRATARIVTAIRAGDTPTPPFCLLAFPSTPEDQLRCATGWAARRFGSASARSEPHRPARDRIHVAYLSADFHAHATAYLLAGLLEHHDRDRFEVTLVSVGPDDGSEMRQRLAAACDRFIDAAGDPDELVAARLRTLRIDILVDLKGYTERARTGVLAARPAPVQVNYLGYPGTMGVPFVDYIVADRVVIPDGDRHHYAEKVVVLPHSYQPNDNRRAMAAEAPPRTALGLPDDGTVFCCFNDPYKILPPVFDCWARILAQVERSVLWLMSGHRRAEDNLRRELAARGIDPARLIFAVRLPHPEHLARHRAADLFLDTQPYNAHTTASDALWAGLPVLTCAGETFAGRVAASLLHAVGLPELITHSLDDYEARAVALAADPPARADLKARLAANRLTMPLFDTARTTRALEAAYEAMLARHRAGLPPDHIEIEDPMPRPATTEGPAA